MVRETRIEELKLYVWMLEERVKVLYRCVAHFGMAWIYNKMYVYSLDKKL